jgi:hypothetical protein
LNPISRAALRGSAAAGETTARSSPSARSSRNSSPAQSLKTPSIQKRTSRLARASVRWRTTVTRPMPSRSAMSLCVIDST